MPAFRICPICGFDGPHGFDVGAPYAVYYYHSGPGGDRSYDASCRYYETDQRAYRLPDQLEEYVRDTARRDSRYNDVRWAAYMLTGGDKRRWAKEIARLGHMTLPNARRVRDTRISTGSGIPFIRAQLARSRQ